MSLYQSLLADFKRFISFFYMPEPIIAPDAQNEPVAPVTHEVVPTTIPTPVVAPVSSVDMLLPWEFGVNGSENNRHNVRVLCDLKGLTLHQKNVITACVEQESDFNPSAVGKPNSNGTVDYGICQFNNGSLRGTPLWIGPGAAFTDTEEVLTNPTKCVNLMIDTFLAGHPNWWMSYSTGAYIKFMPNGDSTPF